MSSHPLDKAPPGPSARPTPPNRPSERLWSSCLPGPRRDSAPGDTISTATPFASVCPSLSEVGADGAGDPLEGASVGRRAERSGAQAAAAWGLLPLPGQPWLRWHRWESQGSSTEGESRGERGPGHPVRVRPAGLEEGLEKPSDPTGGLVIDLRVPSGRAAAPRTGGVLCGSDLP